ncbi:E3 ubiquitin-protein ligase RNF170-like isoform X5 [Stegostoma tigrinum]|uniref:E3 ubiquitin-protein ligase RNF170-like isoform X5 n=1 Tax=Stegostoma tigrinum TaxID=3053191 RepID=UPI00286FDF32|nr:E3 ubiquitin-protein ligase RNF170-like isoform X5 [Stegostoma tigrinum]
MLPQHYLCPSCKETRNCKPVLKQISTMSGTVQFVSRCLHFLWKLTVATYFVVSLLNGLFCENEQEKQGQQIMQDIRNYNKRFSGQSRPFADYVYDMPLLLQMAFRGLFTMAGLMWIFYLRIAICSFGAIMCLTFPLDIIPETVNGILGTADDLTVVILLLFCMIHICQ